MEELEKADELGIIPESLRNKLRSNLTRSSFCDIAVRFTELYFPGVFDSAMSQSRRSFMDTDSDSVSVAAHLGIVMGIDDFSFLPDNQVTRMEVSTMLSRAVKLAFKEYTPLNDNAQMFFETPEAEVVPDWARESVGMMISLDAIKGDGASYALDTVMTGEQAVLLAYRLYDTLRINRAVRIFDENELERMSEIRDLEASLFRPLTEGELYEETPSISEPLVIGRPSDNAIVNGIKAINYARYLANLPYDLTVSGELSAEAQYGAFVMNATDQFTHTPVDDGSLPRDIFARGRDAVGSSNIGMGYRGIKALYEFNMSCMHDSDNQNIDRVGHRRWLLNPNMQTVGMGISGPYCAAKIFDRSRQPREEPEFIAWPGAGVFPIRTDFQLSDLAWSISLDKELGQIQDAAVIVTRTNDNKTWIFDEVGSREGTLEYFNIDNGIFGFGPALIFRPDLGEISHGDEFKVSFAVSDTVSGEYTVKFFM